MSRRATGITASSLRARNTNIAIIETIVADLAKVIDSALFSIHMTGGTRLVYDLPSNFDIIGMSKADAQTLVYSELILLYSSPEPEGKGFEDVKIQLGAESKLIITWRSRYDQDELKSRRDLIQMSINRSANADR